MHLAKLYFLFALSNTDFGKFKMTIKWKKNNKLKPDIILQKLKNLNTKNALDFEFSMSALETMIDFPKETDGRLRRHLLLQVVSVHEDLNTIKIENKLNELIKSLNSKPESVFHILTSISLSRQQQKIFEIGDCKIELLSGNLPDKYTLAREKMLEGTEFSSKEELSGYSKIIISTAEIQGSFEPESGEA